MSRKRISKETRQRVYDKYNGRCAYCGCELELKDMQVGHLKSVYLSEYKGEQVDESFDNYMPACRSCNFYKSTFGLETFRDRIQSIMLKELKKNFSFKFLNRYGIVKVSEQNPLQFYFEGG